MKIDETTRKNVSKLIKEGHTYRKISEMTGISESSISRINKKATGKTINESKNTYFPADLRPQWEALNDIGRRYSLRKRVEAIRREREGSY